MTSTVRTDFDTTDAAGGGQRAAAGTIEEHKMTLLSQDLARERIRDRERDISAAMRVRAVRRSRRNARMRAMRVSRILFVR